MRVITGSARGMSLKTLEGEHTRPTTEKVKEALFSAIQFEIEGRRVLDLFAGSGQLGIEALSRGAHSCVFTESDKNALGIVKENLKKTKLEGNAIVIQTDALSFLSMTDKKFDISFLDPPYLSGLLLKAIEKLECHVSEGGAVICEHPYNSEMPDDIGTLRKQKTYKYGKTAVTIYRKG